MRRTSLKFALLIVTLFTMQAMFGALMAKPISGKVVSATDGEALIGATVQVQGTQTGTVTDFDGNFTLNAEEGQTLVISYVGYLTKKVKITGSQLNIELEEDRKSLDEVVVIGYGVQKKKLVTGATVQVKGEDIAKLNTTNPLQALQGQTPGMTIISQSGQPGEGLKVNIRGLGTTGSSGPLFIIDGVRGDINTVNNSDIESIDVLKDAASAAIYGSQSANGVVLITTRSGKEGRSVVSFDAYFGVQSVARKVKMLNAEQYMTIMDEQNINSGNAAYNWDNYKSIWRYDAEGNKLGVIDTDWIGEMLKDNAQTYGANVSISGGGQKGNYAMSLGYKNEEGVVGGKDVSGYSQYNFRVNSEYQVIDKFLKVGEQISIAYYKKNGIGVGNAYNNTLRSAFGTSPLAPVYSDNGKYGLPYNDTSNSDWFNADGNPYGSMMVNNYNKTQHMRLSSNVYAEMEFIKNLKFRTTLGVTYDSENYRSFTPLYHFSIYSYNDSRTRVSQSASDGFGITWTNTLSYNFDIKDHHFDAMAGYEVYRTEGQSMYGANGSLRDGFETWQYAYLNNGTAMSQENGLSASGSPWDEERMVSFFGRIGWNYKETYMATATIRRDGSSRFAKGHRFGWFPSISAGWVITNEKFMEPLTKFMDYFKIRASWGQVGNQNIGNYMYLAPMAFNNYYYNFGNQLGSDADQWGAVPTRIGNDEITWETTTNFNIGLEFSLFDNRLNGEFNWYNKHTTNLLFWEQLPESNGVRGYYDNIGSIRNRGVELTLSADVIRTKDITWNISGNISHNNAKILKLSPDKIANYGGWSQADVSAGFNVPMWYAEGGQLYNAMLPEYAGVNEKGEPLYWVDEDIYKQYKAGTLSNSSKPGTKHSFTTTDWNEASYYTRNMLPWANGGFSTTLSAYGFDVSANFDFQLGGKIYDFGYAELMQPSYSSNHVGYTYHKDILKAWSPNNTSSNIPRFQYGDQTVTSQSTRFLTSARYLNFQSFMVGYTLPRTLVNKLMLSKIRVYVQGQNLCFWSARKGLDPRFDFQGTTSLGIDSYAPVRTIMGGIQVSF